MLIQVVATFVAELLKEPRIAGVKKLGEGKDNKIYILGVFSPIESISGKFTNYESSEMNRKGDHIVYYSDLSKMRAHYPNWNVNKDLNAIFSETYQGRVGRDSLGR